MHQEMDFFAEQASFLENAPISHQLKLGGLLMTPPKTRGFVKKNTIKKGCMIGSQ